jgi:hypothetical protein
MLLTPSPVNTALMLLALTVAVPDDCTRLLVPSCSNPPVPAVNVKEEPRPVILLKLESDTLNPAVNVEPPVRSNDW